MSKILRKREFDFFLKKSSQIGEEEKEELHDFLVKMYPNFKKYYDKNRFYSSVEPQITFIVKKNRKIVGSGKLLWRQISVGKKKIKFFGTGLLIDTDFQRKGLGKKLIQLQINEAKKRNANVLYGSTKNPVAAKLLEKLGFVKIDIPIFYKETLSGKIVKDENWHFMKFFSNRIATEIKKTSKLYIGNGPI